LVFDHLQVIHLRTDYTFCSIHEVPVVCQLITISAVKQDNEAIFSESSNTKHFARISPCIITRLVFDVASAKSLTEIEQSCMRHAIQE